MSPVWQGRNCNGAGNFSVHGAGPRLHISELVHAEGLKCFRLLVRAAVWKPMDYDQFTQGFPFESALTSNSVEELEEQMLLFGVDQRMRQVGRGSFRSALAVRTTDQADLYTDRFNTSFSMLLESPAGSVGFVLGLSATGEMIAAGENIANDKLMLVPDGFGVDIWGANFSGSESVTISKARFYELCDLLCPASRPADRLDIFSDPLGELPYVRNSIQRRVRRHSRCGRPGVVDRNAGGPSVVEAARAETFVDDPHPSSLRPRCRKASAPSPKTIFAVPPVSFTC